MADVPTITLWMGRPIEDLSREELQEVVQYYAREYHRLMTPSAIHARALGQVEMIKRGER